MSPTGPLVVVGCYTPHAAGRGHGISTYRQDRSTGALVPSGTPSAPAPAPSYLAAHPSARWVYAVAELQPRGRVGTFPVGVDGVGRALGWRDSHGGAPCHLAVHPSGRFLAVANYADGVLTVHHLAGSGVPDPQPTAVVALRGSGPDPDRQAGPHAHQAVFTPDGTWLVVVDLGGDAVHHFALDTVTGALHEGPRLDLPGGTGPRHLAFGPAATTGQPALAPTDDHGGSAWLVGELDPVLVPLYRSPAHDGTLRVAGDPVPTGAPHAVRPIHPSAVVVSPDGRFLYVGNRGVDTVSVFASGAPGSPSSAGAAGNDRPKLLAEYPAGATNPRDVALVGDFVYVAGQDSDTVTAFRRDPVDGLLQPLGVVARTGSPSCLIALCPAPDPAEVS